MRAAAWALLAAAALVACGGRADDGEASPGARESAAPSDLPIPAVGALDAPNVILVTIDTLRADRLSSYGAKGVETPSFDRIASQGIRFTNASSTAPLTLPAHSSILTGTYPPHHGVRENVGYRLSEASPTLAQLLKQAGWRTAGFVSAFVLDRQWGIARGFEHYFDEFEPPQRATASPDSVSRDGRQTLDAALAWLRENHPSENAEAAPFFLWLHLFDPHAPYAPPEPFLSRYPDRPYDGEVAYVDSLVGELFDELRTTGLLESTLLVVTADHGEGLGDHGEAYHGYFVYDSTIRVPLIVRLPDRAAKPELAGRVVDRVVSHVDIAPTVLGLAGLDTPSVMQGRSLLGPSAQSVPREGVYAESLFPLLHYGWAPFRSLRTDRHKLIGTPEPELFDLLADPAESRNLVDSEPGLFAEIDGELERTIAFIEEGAVEPAPSPELDEQTLSQLRALGYVAGRGGLADLEDGASLEDPKRKFHLYYLIMRAEASIAAGAPGEAAALLSQALAEDPGLLDAHQLSGTIEFEAGRPAAAIEHFERALALDPAHLPSLYGRAASLAALGRVDEAIEGFGQLLRKMPSDSKTSLAVADLEVKRGRPERALAVLEAAAALDGAPASIHERLGVLLAMAGRPAEAEAAVVRAIERNPVVAQPHFTLAVLLEGRGELEEARQSYERAIELDPGHFRAQFNLGQLYARLGRPELQERLYRDAIASSPGESVPYFYLAKLVLDRGADGAEAERLARQGLERDAGSAFGWFVLGEALERLGKNEEAARAFSRGRSLDPGQSR